MENMALILASRELRFIKDGLLLKHYQIIELPNYQIAFRFMCNTPSLSSFGRAFLFPYFRSSFR